MDDLCFDAENLNRARLQHRFFATPDGSAVFTHTLFEETEDWFTHTAGKGEQ